MKHLLTANKQKFFITLLAMSLLVLTACSAEQSASESTNTSMPMNATATAVVQQPAPGIDIDRSTAVGQVVDSQGQLGWYPHEGGLMEYSVDIRFGMEPNTMPAGWYFGRVSAVATDSNNDVYVFQRDNVADPIIVFDSEGTYLRSLGSDIDFVNEHGMRIDKYDNIWVTDNRDHFVMKLSNEGEVLMTLGIPGQDGVTDQTFGRPADIAFGPNDEIYIADGYGNSRVVKYDAEGNFVRTWGSPGTEPGQFDLVHSIATDSTGNVYVADRENNRIQIFDEDGNLLRIWTHTGATQNIFITPNDEVWIMTHRDSVENITYDTLAGRIMRLDIETGEILGAMESPGHWLDVSPSGEIYIGSLTGNVFKWYEDWMEASEAAQAERARGNL